jgi:hypothetical protein
MLGDQMLSALVALRDAPAIPAPPEMQVHERHRRQNPSFAALEFNRDGLEEQIDYWFNFLNGAYLWAGKLSNAGEVRGYLHQAAMPFGPGVSPTWHGNDARTLFENRVHSLAGAVANFICCARDPSGIGIEQFKSCVAEFARIANQSAVDKHDAIDAKNRPAAKQSNAPRGKRGPKPIYDAKKDGKLFADYQSSGLSAKDFAIERRLNSIAVAKAIARHRANTSRAQNALSSPI